MKVVFVNSFNGEEVQEVSQVAMTSLCSGDWVEFDGVKYTVDCKGYSHSSKTIKIYLSKVEQW